MLQCALYCALNRSWTPGILLVIVLFILKSGTCTSFVTSRECATKSMASPYSCSSHRRPYLLLGLKEREVGAPISLEEEHGLICVRNNVTWVAALEWAMAGPSWGTAAAPSLWPSSSSGSMLPAQNYAPRKGTRTRWPVFKKKKKEPNTMNFAVYFGTSWQVLVL